MAVDVSIHIAIGRSRPTVVQPSKPGLIKKMLSIWMYTSMPRKNVNLCMCQIVSDMSLSASCLRLLHTFTLYLYFSLAGTRLSRFNRQAGRGKAASKSNKEELESILVSAS